MWCIHSKRNIRVQGVKILHVKEEMQKEKKQSGTGEKQIYSQITGTHEKAE